jgi:TRAP-type C4-dicarboxylate transport system permease small subunit
MKRFRYVVVCFCAMLVMAGTYAQEKLNLDEKPEMAVSMRSNGKIYVVVAVVVFVLLGLFLYLINLDRKVRRIEGLQDASPDAGNDVIRKTGIKDIHKNVSN